jgi:hypothetical protein
MEAELFVNGIHYILCQLSLQYCAQPRNHLMMHTYHTLQSVLNSEAFNPTTQCKESKYCTGNGGLLAFMETPSPACSSGAGAGAGASEQPNPNLNMAQRLSGGAIAGIVIGSICGVLLLSLPLWLYLLHK